ncbi:MAG: hypothetical protein M2R45_04021 [Verrucomicrobia subdivision 3 bacterium]|nr:hypothetical protein [Limisphaerales bacterium]MCS1416228.1 hypothetical protein [Limisphaerales bacterium]
MPLSLPQATSVRIEKSDLVGCVNGYDRVKIAVVITHGNGPIYRRLW